MAASTTFTPFGLSLADATPEGCPAPLIVTHCLEFLSAHASPAPQDLFDESKADQTIVKKLRIVFDRFLDPLAPSLIQTLKVPPYTVAQLFVWYLRELPEPVFPEKYLHTFMKIIGIENLRTRAVQLRVILYKLPELSRHVLLSVFEYLYESHLQANCYANILAPLFFKPPEPVSPEMLHSLALIFTEYVAQSSYMNKIVNEPHIPPSTLPMVTGSDFLIKAVALYDFPGGQYLIAFKKGDQLNLLDVKLEPGWMQARKGTEIGYIPEAYVAIVPEEPPKMPSFVKATPSDKSTRRLSAPPSSLSKSRIVHAKSRVLVARPSASPTPEDPEAPPAPEEAAKPSAEELDWKSKLTPEELEELPHMMAGREVRAKEIMTSEQSYVEFLKIMNDLFVKPLKVNPMGLSKEDILAVFSNVDVLESCHEELLKIIESRVQNWGENSVIGDVFLTNTGFIKFYRYYVNNYEASLEALEKCKKKSEEFAIYVSNMEQTSQMRNLKLVSFLVTPVQRVMRYSMLLEEVLKKTPKGHPDQEPLRHAVAMTKSMAQYINEKKRNVENLAAFEDFLRGLKGFSGEVTQNPRRVLLKQGEAALNTASAHVHLFLFTDLLFITKPAKHDKFAFKSMLVVSKCTITADRTQAFTSFKIEFQKSESVTLIFENPGDAEAWFKALFSASQAQNDFEKLARTSSSMRFVLTEDSEFSQRANMARAKKQRGRLEMLIEKEVQFSERINKTWKVFMEPLQNGKDQQLLKNVKVSMLCTNLNLIRTLQPPFIDAMKARLAEWNRTNAFSDVIKANINYIRSFILYLTHFQGIMDTLAEANSNSAFQFWLVRLEADNKTTFEQEIAEPLNHFYDLFFLLQEFSLVTRKDNPDGEEMKAIMAKVKAIKEDFVLHATKFKSIPAVDAVLKKFTTSTPVAESNSGSLLAKTPKK